MADDLPDNPLENAFADLFGAPPTEQEAAEAVADLRRLVAGFNYTRSRSRGATDEDIAARLADVEGRTRLTFRDSYDLELRKPDGAPGGQVREVIWGEQPRPFAMVSVRYSGGATLWLMDDPPLTEEQRDAAERRYRARRSPDGNWN